MHRLVQGILLASICPLFLSCAAARLPNQGNVKAPIEMNSYRIILADEGSWKDWEASVRAEQDALTLRKLKIWPLNGEVQGLTTMIVAKDSFSPHGSSLSEADHADTIRAMEEKFMKEEGVKKGAYELKDLATGDLVRNGRKLYYMTWTTDGKLPFPTLNRRTAYTKNAMYLYFPEGFAATRTLYRFLIADTLYPPTFLQANIEQIYSIIDGFAIK